MSLRMSADWLFRASRIEEEEPEAMLNALKIPRGATVADLIDNMNRNGQQFAPAAPDARACEQGRDARSDVADNGSRDGYVTVDFGRRDVDLNELLRLTPGLAFAV